MPSFKSIFPCLGGKKEEPAQTKEEESAPVEAAAPVEAEQTKTANIAEPATVSTPTDEDHNDSDVEDPEEEALKKYQNRTGRGRKSVAAERYNPEDDDDDDEPLKVVPKSDEQRKRLIEVSKKIMLLSRLDEEQLRDVLNAMEERQVSEDDVVIQQGDDGDNFYVIDSGNYDIYIDENKVGSYNGTGFFGELALMYNVPRAATIKASSEGLLWSLDRKNFQRIIVKANANKRKQFEDFLMNLSVLENINEMERSKIADVMESQKFKAGDVIIKQGDKIDSGSFVYFLIEGNCSVSINANGEDKVVKEITPGTCFGEVALIKKEPRSATITALTNVTAGVLDVNAFERLLGPCRDIMARNIDEYAKENAQVSETPAEEAPAEETPAE